MAKFFFLALLLTLTACDWQRKRHCEWYLLPFPQGNVDVEVGTVSACVANFTLKKKKCYFQISPELAEKFNGVPFKYSEMSFTKTHPKVIESMEGCSVQ